MTANDIFQDSRGARIRELKAKNARLNEELAHTRAELESLRSHFDLTLAAALDAARRPADGRLLIVDGWNALLGSASVLSPEERTTLAAAAKRDRLAALVQDWLAAHPQDFAWIVYDGAHAGGHVAGRLRVSFTGGTGPHRADRLVCDYLRMRRLTGAPQPVVVFTEDDGFAHEATALGAEVHPVGALRGV